MILRHPRDKSTPPLLSHPTTALSNHRFPTPIPSDTPLLLPIPIPSEEYESLIRFAPSQRPCRSLSRPSLPAVTTNRFPTAPCRPRIEESFKSFEIFARISNGASTHRSRAEVERRPSQRKRSLARSPLALPKPETRRFRDAFFFSRLASKPRGERRGEMERARA